MSETTSEVLRTSLSAAIPMWIENLKKKPIDEVMARGPEIAQIIATKGDVIEFKSKTKGETGEAFNRLAEGLASLAFLPGGIDFMGLHFEAEHPDVR